ncbi:MAG TPA: hypothetical protein VF148_14020 [Acidimicrobiia bacterium]
MTSRMVGFVDRLTAVVPGSVSTNLVVALLGLLLVGLGARGWIRRNRESVAEPDNPVADSDGDPADDVPLMDRRDGLRPHIALRRRDE